MRSKSDRLPSEIKGHCWHILKSLADWPGPRLFLFFMDPYSPAAAPSATPTYVNSQGQAPVSEGRAPPMEAPPAYSALEQPPPAALPTPPSSPTKKQKQRRRRVEDETGDVENDPRVRRIERSAPTGSPVSPFGPNNQCDPFELLCCCCIVFTWVPDMLFCILDCIF